MDVSNINKPIHIVCPYCKKDLKYHGASIKSRKEGAIKRLESLKKKIGEAKSDEKRKELKKQYNKTADQLKHLSEDYHMLSQMSEMEVLKIFKNKVKKMLPAYEYMKLLEEAEDQYLEENTFNYYDLAIQKYTNFDGI